VVPVIAADREGGITNAICDEDGGRGVRAPVAGASDDVSLGLHGLQAVAQAGSVMG
jgi:hypothetical protein